MRMNNAFLLTILFFFTYQLTAQSPKAVLNGKATGINLLQDRTNIAKDTIPNVIYLKEKKSNLDDVLFYINGQEMAEYSLELLDPNDIEAISVEKKNIEIRGKMYTGQIYIETKEDYQPKLISLNKLKEKYVDIESSTPTLFMIDDKIIEKNYDTHKVDEKYIMSIEVKKIKNSEEELYMNVIKLVSRTDENIKKANTILIRGDK